MKDYSRIDMVLDWGVIEGITPNVETLEGIISQAKEKMWGAGQILETLTTLSTSMRERIGKAEADIAKFKALPKDIQDKFLILGPAREGEKAYSLRCRH